METAKNRTNRRFIVAIVCIVLAACMVIGGTLAYLTAKSNQVVNTFAAVEGLIDNDSVYNAPPTIYDENGTEIENPNIYAGFYLVEHQVERDSKNNTYSFTDPDKYVLGAGYDNLVAGQFLPKDPSLTVNIVDNVNAYVFMVVNDLSGGILQYEVDDMYWVKLNDEDVNVGENYSVYVYEEDGSSLIVGKESVELDMIPFLKNENDDEDIGVIVDPDMDVDEIFNNNSDGEIGNLIFTAYACQADGFSGPLDAWRECFGDLNEADDLDS